MHKLLITVTIALVACPADAALVVELGDATVDLSSGVGTSALSFDVFIKNPTGSALPLSGYSLFLDIGPVGQQLPAGVTFDEPAATYVAGQGVAPLVGAGPGTMNLAPAAGDLGLGQLQFFDGMIDPGERHLMLSIQLLVDYSVAIPGFYDIFLNPQGESSLAAVSGPQDFTVDNGQLILLSTPSLPGDYSNDGLVNAADLTLWQNSFGLPAGTLPNDVDGGVIGGAQFLTWQRNHNSSALQTTAIPEPSCLALLLGTVTLAFSANSRSKCIRYNQFSTSKNNSQVA